MNQINPGTLSSFMFQSESSLPQTISREYFTSFSAEMFEVANIPVHIHKPQLSLNLHPKPKVRNFLLFPAFHILGILVTGWVFWVIFTSLPPILIHPFLLIAPRFASVHSCTQKAFEIM